MMRGSLLALLALGVLSPAARAHDLGNGLAVTGDVKLEYTALDHGSDHLTAAGDASLTWRSGGMLGFDAALDTLYLLDDGDDLTNVWAALVLATPVGDFALGAPRPVRETMAVMPRFSSSRLLDLELIAFNRSITGMASFADNGMTPGIAYDTTLGQLSWGLSFHRIDSGSGDADFYQGAMNYRSGATTWFVNGEIVDAPGSNGSSLQIGGLHEADRYALGAALGNIDMGPNSYYGRVYGSYDVLPALAVKGDAMTIENGPDLLSISSEYRFGRAGYVAGGVTFIDDSSNDRLYDIGVGLRF